MARRRKWRTAMAFEEEYEDVLQNIEFAIISVYEQNPDLTDVNVDNALDGLVRIYTAEERGRTAPTLRLNALEREVYERVKTVCDWRLGRSSLGAVGEADASAEELIVPSDAITVEEIIACLKRIRKSIKLWTTEFGRRGYLNFVNQFFSSGE